MVKFLQLALLSGLSLSPLKITHNDYKDNLQTSSNSRGNYTLTNITANSFDEFRIYHYDELLIDEVDDLALANLTCSALGLTNSIKHINNAAFENAPSIKYLEFTGSENEYEALGLTHEFLDVSFYAFDEGFINFWNSNVRTEETTNICDISRDIYNKTISLYKALNDDDLAFVNIYVDAAGVKIEDSIKELIKHHSDGGSAQKNDEWNQTSAITFIIVVALFGMTSITIFYIFKTRKIID